MKRRPPRPTLFPYPTLFRSAKPANSVGAGADLEPLVLVIQDPQLCAVVNGEGGGGFCQRTIAHYRFAGNDNGGASEAGFAQGGGNAGAQYSGEYGQREDIHSQSGFERRSPLQHGQKEQPKPNRDDGQQRPFVQSQSSEPALPSARRQSMALRLVPRKLKVGARVRIARGKLLGGAVGGHGAPDLAGLEERIAEIEIEGGGSLAGLSQFLIGGNCVSELR